MQDFVVRTPAQLGPLVTSFRRARRMSQTELASRLGIAQQAVSRLERDPRVVSTERLMRALAALGVELVLRDAQARAPASGRTGSTRSPPW